MKEHTVKFMLDESVNPCTSVINLLSLFKKRKPLIQIEFS